tara:strand:- start:246 stop:770 length:525 start_codon:yes stop_codon:yes gene_type:complete
MVAKIAQNRSDALAFQNVELELYPQDLATILFPCWGAEYQKSTAEVISGTREYVAGYFEVSAERWAEDVFYLYGKLVIFDQIDMKFYIGRIQEGDERHETFVEEYKECLWENPLRYNLTSEFFSELLRYGGVFRRLPLEVPNSANGQQLVDFTAVLKGEFSPRSNWKAGKETFK